MTDKRQTTYLQHNIEARSREYCCRVKEVLIIMSVYL